MCWTSIFNRLCVWLARPIFGYSSKIHVSGQQYIPRTGAFLLASNHISHFDPPLLSCLVPRHIEWMATKELFGSTIGKRFFPWLGAIPVDRTQADSNVLRVAAHRLKSGAVIGIFPEGGIRDGEQSILGSNPGKPGFATLSILTNVPVVPCTILGTDRLYEAKYWNPKQRILGIHRVPLWIAFGKPIQPPIGLPKHEARDRLHRQVIVSIKSLADLLKQQFMLNPEDFPQSAQKRRSQTMKSHTP